MSCWESLKVTFCLHMSSSSLDKPVFSRVKTCFRFLLEILPKGFNSLCLTDPVDGAVSTSFVYGGFSAKSGHRS